VGARTDAARAEVLAARSALDDEIVRLEASGRAAVDIPARIRREPAKVAGAAAGGAFLLLGGPGRVFRGVRRAIFGPDADLPKSMLPDEVEKTLRKLGKDGERVRGTLEREFASYLDEKAPERRDRDLRGALAAAAVALIRPASVRIGKQLAERALDPDRPSFAEGMRRARERQQAKASDAPPKPPQPPTAGA
jgi:hypothetical protein